MKDGIYTDLIIDEYHNNDTHISATQIKMARKSLKEFFWYRSGLIERPKKIYFDFGNAFELALMDRKEFESRVTVFDVNRRPEQEKTIKSKQNQDWKKEVFNTDKYVVNADGTESYDTIVNMIESCYRDTVIKVLLENTQYQSSYFWTDEETGIKLKTRPDICKRQKNVIVNVKTIVDGSPESFSRDLAKFAYPLQAVIEIEGVLKCGGMQSVDNYFWLVVEKTPPFNATIYEFSQDDIGWCTDEFHYILHKIKKAQDQNLYPGYSERADNKWGILTAEIPLWYKRAS